MVEKEVPFFFLGLFLVFSRAGSWSIWVLLKMRGLVFRRAKREAYLGRVPVPHLEEHPRNSKSRVRDWYISWFPPPPTKMSWGSLSL